MRLYGFINVFKLEPTFLQPIFIDQKQLKSKYYFQHSEDKTTISSFEPADYEYYKKNSKIIVLPKKDAFVQIGSTVIFAIYMDNHVLWGDYLDIQNVIKLSLENKKYFNNFPGFYNTCAQFLEEYAGKTEPEADLSRALKNKVIMQLFDFCHYEETSRLDFVDLYFNNDKEIAKFWSVNIIKDLIFSMVRVRVQENYVYSLLNDYWDIDLLESLIPFREQIENLPHIAIFEIRDFVENLIIDEDINSLFLIDFVRIKKGYVLIAENYLTNKKHFVAMHSYSAPKLYHTFKTLIDELLSNCSQKLHLIICSLYIDENEQCKELFDMNSDKIQVVDFPAGNKIELH